MNFLKVFFIFFSSILYSQVIDEKVIICGVAKNVEAAVPNTIRSIETIGAQFSDYQVIIYENNSGDGTKKLFRNWAKKNSKVIFISENVSHEQLGEESCMRKENRTESIARARNIVLDQIMRSDFDDFKYVIISDLDFAWYPWDVDNIVDTILHPEHEWDAVFANGFYDEFALRTPELPIGYELVGAHYWWFHEKIRNNVAQYFEDKSSSSTWKKVYSAFGGLAIYKREAMKDCRYSGVVTKDLETVTLKWLEEAYKNPNTPLLSNYQTLLNTLPVYNIKSNYIHNRHTYPDHIGVYLNNKYGNGKIVWFSCERDDTLPWTCEHIPFHATMILNGHDKLFINPRLIQTVAGPP
jgi:hypothetical protein